MSRTHDRRVSNVLVRARARERMLFDVFVVYALVVLVAANDDDDDDDVADG